MIRIKKNQITVIIDLLCQSDGEVAGQEVFHVHLHVVPRFAGDSLTITYDVELWDESRRSQLDEIAFRIRQHL